MLPLRGAVLLTNPWLTYILVITVHLIHSSSTSSRFIKLTLSQLTGLRRRVLARFIKRNTAVSTYLEQQLPESLLSFQQLLRRSQLDRKESAAGLRALRRL